MTPEEINQLITQYGRPAFDLVMKQVYINAVGSLIWGVVFLVVTVVLLAVTIRVYHRWQESDDSYTTDDILTFLFGLGTAGAAFVALLLLWGVSALLNPEFAALRLLIAGAR